METVTLARGTRGPAQLEPVPAMWKFLCALAILVGHNLVTWKALRPGSDAIRLSFDLLQFFSPFHFFLFSGYFAASGLKDSSRGIAGFAIGRGSDLPLRIGMGLSILLGGAFHHLVERPSGPLVRRIQGR